MALKIVNILLALSALGQIASGLFLRELQAVSFHKLNGKIFIALAVCHVFLNRAWIKTAFFKTGKRPDTTGN